MPKFRPLPTKTVPDYQAVIAHAKKHGVMYLAPEGVNTNAAHVALYRAGLGICQVKVAGKIVGYSVQPIKRHQPKET